MLECYLGNIFILLKYILYNILLYLEYCTGIPKTEQFPGELHLLSFISTNGTILF